MARKDEMIDLETHTRVAKATSQLLEALGYDTEEQHFRNTPQRVARSLIRFRKNGSLEEAAELLGVRFKAEYSELVMCGPVRYVSMCAHHLLPVTGNAWLGYLPGGEVCGLSKLPRLVRHFAGQFSVQENVTEDIANTLTEVLRPRGCMVVIRAVHDCMSIRGVEEPQAATTTSAVRGLFKESASLRSEFLSLMRDSR